MQNSGRPVSNAGEAAEKAILKTQQDHGSGVPTSSAAQTSLDPALDPASFPDGGLRAWLTVGGCFCAWFVSFGWMQSVGVFQAYYERKELRTYSHDEIAWITSLVAFWQLAGGLIVGPLTDRLGPRIPLIIGTVMHSGLLADRHGVDLLPAIACVVSWFHKKRGLALGIAAAGSGAASVIIPLVVRSMILDQGFPWTMRTCAFLILFMGTIACLTCTSRLPPTPKGSPKAIVLASLKDKKFVFMAISGPFNYLGQYLVFTFIVTTAIYRNVDPDWAFYLVPISNASGIFGRIILGYLADRTGAITMFNYSCLLTFLSVACVWIPVSGKAGSIVFALLFGFGSGAMLAMGAAAIAAVSDPRQIGIRTGIAYALAGVVTLFGSPAGGAIINSSGYRAMQAFTQPALECVWCLRYMSGISLVGGI
ncbi:Riboflavin transporter MCH5 [Cyphellophora attinorum]|uniref:Riboflavin transporter MCH5 n=1 Tax=Cyphellophora attinorum TaxID=1664694 RepID=A0A0N1HHI9_9EURO|nr:Riboflavin transporter MCH5 [Phialophora attinorum]KPI35256.1 Riboflavin transporter MCH5 [Phialophora attinorum]